VSRCETNAHLRDSILVRSILSGFLSFFIILSFSYSSFPFYPTLCLSSLSYLIISPVPTCLVHNCETSQRSLYSHLLSLLSRDQITFDPHQRGATKRTPNSTPHDSKHLRVYYVLTPLNASTAKANTWLMTTSVPSGEIDSTKTSTQRKHKKPVKSEPIQFA